ncbi:hypothetical protein DLJ46_08930 [Micromonospora globispora]|uniref:Uncharacterized protein n=1 Tax=Micromonospora globispora TaxID=1450148 RepID=A0A317KBY4_9ACTN|nr:hypothetical protein DLJ46_08930 [Micromonospora globispora]
MRAEKDRPAALTVMSTYPGAWAPGPDGSAGVATELAAPVGVAPLAAGSSITGTLWPRLTPRRSAAGRPRPRRGRQARMSWAEQGAPRPVAVGD